MSYDDTISWDDLFKGQFEEILESLNCVLDGKTIDGVSYRLKPYSENLIELHIYKVVAMGLLGKKAKRKIAKIWFCPYRITFCEPFEEVVIKDIPTGDYRRLWDRVVSMAPRPSKSAVRKKVGDNSMFLKSIIKQEETP